MVLELKPKGSILDLNVKCNNPKLDITININKLMSSKDIKRDGPPPFKIVEDFVDFANIEYEYAELFKQTYHNIHMLKSRSEIRQNINDIINLFKYDRLKEFIHSQGYKPPTSISENYDRDKIENNLISPDRTYVYEDYYNLLTIIIPIKAIAPLLAYYMAISPSIFITKKETLIALEFIKDSWVWYSTAMERLERYIKAHVDSIANEELLFKIGMIKNIPVDEIYNYILSLALFKRGVAAQILKIPGQQSLITQFYKVAISNIRNNTNSVNSITLKMGIIGEDDEGAIESVRQSSIVPISLQTQYDFFCSDPHKLLDMLPIEFTEDDHKLLDAILDNLSALLTKDGIRLEISNIAEEMVNIVTNGIIPFGWKKLISRKSFINLMAVTALYIYKLGYAKLAVIVLSYNLNSDELVIESNTSHISKNIAQKLKELYPLEEEEISKFKSSFKPIIFTLINRIDSRLKKQPVVSLAPEEMLEYGNRTYSTYPGIRDDIANVILNIKGYYNGRE